MNVDLFVCNECGARVVGERVAKEMLDRGKMDCEAQREQARLCPDCSRRRTAAALRSTSAVLGGRSEVQSQAGEDG